MENIERAKAVSVESDGLENEKDRALVSAMELFWHCGAEVASYSDIVAASGLSRKALYRMWPDKESLIADTFVHYRKQVLPHLTGKLNLGGREGIVAFWETLENAAQQDGWDGCYLFRTAGGPMRYLDFVQKNFCEHLDELEQKFATEIAAAQKEGSIRPEIDAELAGQQSMGIIGLISSIGAQVGYGQRVARLIGAGRSSCGL